VADPRQEEPISLLAVGEERARRGGVPVPGQEFRLVRMGPKPPMDRSINAPSWSGPEVWERPCRSVGRLPAGKQGARLMSGSPNRGTEHRGGCEVDTSELGSHQVGATFAKTRKLLLQFSSGKFWR
jgi:hypothetical protein